QRHGGSDDFQTVGGTFDQSDLRRPGADQPGSFTARLQGGAVERDVVRGGVAGRASKQGVSEAAYRGGGLVREQANAGCVQKDAVARAGKVGAGGARVHETSGGEPGALASGSPWVTRLARDAERENGQELRTDQRVGIAQVQR